MRRNDLRRTQLILGCSVWSIGFSEDENYQCERILFAIPCDVDHDSALGTRQGFASAHGSMGRAGYPGGYYYRRLADDGHFNTLVGNVRPTAKQSRVIHPSVRIVSFSSGGPLYAELVVSNIASFLSASKLALKAFLTGFGLKARSNNKHNRLVSLFTAVQLLTEG